MIDRHQARQARLASGMIFDIIEIDALPEAVFDLFTQATASGDNWKSNKWLGAKAQLKAALFKCQKGQCAYCRRIMKDDLGSVEIDHILPKLPCGPADKWTSNHRQHRKATSGYPDFRFMVYNLILVCKRCNNKKGTFDCRKDRSIAAGAQYSFDEDYYEWVHPFAHRYSDHIEILDGLIYHAREGSVNGECVISVCKLDEIAAVEKAASEIRILGADSYAKAIGKLLYMVDDLGWDSVIEVVHNQFPNVPVESLNAVVEQYKAAWTV